MLHNTHLLSEEDYIDAPKYTFVKRGLY
jgi:hypothetical protein